MNLIHILVDSLADDHLTNAQMVNARQIVQRLDPERFHVSIFHVKAADPLIVARPNTRLIKLPAHKQTLRIFREFVIGKHDLVFYLKPSPAAKWYLQSRQHWNDKRPVVGTVEQVCLSNLSTPSPSVRAWLPLWERTILRSDHLFSNAESVKKSVQEVYGRDTGIVPTGVDTGFFTPASDRAINERVKVMFAGSIREYKEPQTVVQAAVRYPQADFIIVGEGYLRSELQQKAERDRIHNVRFTGPLSQQAIRQQLRNADIFFYPSHWEGSPKVVAEAAACGLPVIVRNDYDPETVLDGKTGYIVSSDDELFARLEKLLNDAELRRRFGTAGREHIRKFDWDPIARQWEEVFLSILRAGSQAGLHHHITGPASLSAN